MPSSQGLMKEMGRQEVEPSREPLPGDVPRRLPTAMFEAMSSRDTSIPLDDLQGIKSGRTKGYPSTSAQGLQVQVAAWRLLVEAHTADMFHKLQDRYLATLLQEDGIVVNQATCQCHIVLKTCAYGALLWPCSKHEEAGFRYFTPCVEPGVQASWKAVLDADAWLSIPCVAVPPVVLCCLVGHHSELPTGVVALQTGGDDTIWRGAARAGFKGVTESSMNKILAENHLLDGMEEDQKPKGLLPKVELLVLFFLPGLPDEELAAIIKERAGITRRQRRSLIMLAENLEHATGCLDPTDHMDAKEHKATAHSAELSMKSQTLRYLADRKFIDPVTVERELIECGVKQAPEPAATLRTAKAKVMWSWSEKYLKERLPQLRGCSIQEVVNARNTSWIAYYPGVKPGSRSRSYSSPDGAEAAAKHVFRWAWETHHRLTGAAIPYDLEGELTALGPLVVDS